ncbi:hypothetical protein E5Q_03816 [Mixia osmundae IAM 14324]|nr:hypothetical protein E5Q_03816 [Mixia osmundae IAM 14324]
MTFIRLATVLALGLVTLVAGQNPGLTIGMHADWLGPYADGEAVSDGKSLYLDPFNPVHLTQCEIRNDLVCRESKSDDATILFRKSGGKYLDITGMYVHCVVLDGSESNTCIFRHRSSATYVTFEAEADTLYTMFAFYLFATLVASLVAAQDPTATAPGIAMQSVSPSQLLQGVADVVSLFPALNAAGTGTAVQQVVTVTATPTAASAPFANILGSFKPGSIGLGALGTIVPASSAAPSVLTVTAAAPTAAAALPSTLMQSAPVSGSATQPDTAAAAQPVAAEPAVATTPVAAATPAGAEPVAAAASPVASLA